jgi:hypothetical protein
LAKKSSSYVFIAKVIITHPPIRVLSATSNGWRSLAVWVQGGGIQPGYEAELRVDGKTYPNSAANPSARRLVTAAPGEVVIESLKNAKPLYP